MHLLWFGGIYRDMNYLSCGNSVIVEADKNGLFNVHLVIPHL